MGDGWFHTGDAAVVHPDGYVQITDRLKDVIISGGENISSVEVEAMLLRHDAIQEVAVVGVPHEKWGEAPHAFVVFKTGQSATPEALRAFCRENMAHFKVPHEFTPIAELPKTATGKIQKFVLRQGTRQHQRAVTRAGSADQTPNTAAITIAGQTPCVNREKPDARIAVSSRQPCAVSADVAAIARSGDSRRSANAATMPTMAIAPVQIAIDIHHPLHVAHALDALKSERAFGIEREGQLFKRHRAMRRDERRQLRRPIGMAQPIDGPQRPKVHRRESRERERRPSDAGRGRLRRAIWVCSRFIQPGINARDRSTQPPCRQVS